MKGFFIRVGAGLLLAGLLVGSGWWLVGEAAVSTIYVDASAADGGDGSEAHPYNDFVTGLYAAQNGGHDKLIVRSGTYEVDIPDSNIVEISSDIDYCGGESTCC